MNIVTDINANTIKNQLNVRFYLKGTFNVCTTQTTQTDNNRLVMRTVCLLIYFEFGVLNCCHETNTYNILPMLAQCVDHICERGQLEQTLWLEGKNEKCA